MDFSQRKTQALAAALRNPEPDTLAFAREQYPFINKFDPHVKINPRQNAGFAETFPPNEEGAGDFQRPAEFPIGSTGVEVYRPSQFSPDDLAGEFLHVDPRANAVRADLLKTFTPRQMDIMQHEPDYTDSIKSGQSPARAMQNMTDGVMRGYTVNQWPQRAIQDFGLNLNQMLMLDGLKNYMQTGRE